MTDVNAGACPVLLFAGPRSHLARAISGCLCFSTGNRRADRLPGERQARLPALLTAAKSNTREGRPDACGQSMAANPGSSSPGSPMNQRATPSCPPPSASPITSSFRHSLPRSFQELDRRIRSTDLGQTWKFDQTPVPDLGEGNPASLTRLAGGTLCLCYGIRQAPFGIYAHAEPRRRPNLGTATHHPRPRRRPRPRLSASNFSVLTVK